MSEWWRYHKYPIIKGATIKMAGYSKLLAEMAKLKVEADRLKEEAANG